jgi:hypothetical protein
VAKILRSPTGQNLSIEKYPKNLLKIIDKHLKGKTNIILKYATDEVNKLLEPYDVRLGETALRKRISQLKLDKKILRGKIKGVDYAPKDLTSKNLIIKDFVEETNKKITEAYNKKNLNKNKIYDVDLGTDLAKKLGKNVTAKQALTALGNYSRQIDKYDGVLPELDEGYRVYDRAKPQKLIDLEKVRVSVGNELVEKYNNEIPFTKRETVLEEAGYPKGSRWILNELDSREDKVVKATESLFKDPARKAEDLFNPLQKIAKLVYPYERKGSRGGVERIRVDDVTRYVNKNFPDLRPIITKLSNSNVKLKIQNNAKKGQIITLEDVETGLRTGTDLPFTKNVYARMVHHAARHQSQATPGKALTQLYDENGKIIRDLRNLDSYSNVTFKYRPNTSVDFNKIKEVYGVNRGLVEVPKGSKFVDLTFEAEKLPQFKEYFSKVEEIEKLKRKDVIHPVTKKPIKFFQLMGEVYKKGAGYTKSYERFPYDIDHKLGVMADPFKDLRVVSQRLNVGGGQANFRNPQLLKKMGYGFDKDINQLFNDEIKLAEDVLVKGRKLRSSYGVAKDFVEKGRQAASAYVPEIITDNISKIKPGSGFGKIFGILKQNIIAKATNNDNNICEVVFGAKGLANGGSAGGGCAKQMELEFDKAPEQTLNKIAQSSNSTLKGFAQRSLSLFPKLGTVGKIATVAAGTGLALSGLRFNPEKGEIVTTDNDQKADQNQILQYVKDNPLKVTAGTSLGFAAQEVPGAYKAARDLGRGRVRSTLGISGAIRPVLTTFGTPLLTGLYEGAIGAKRLDEGETMTDILTDPLDLH